MPDDILDDDVLTRRASPIPVMDPAPTAPAIAVNNAMPALPTGPMAQPMATSNRGIPVQPKTPSKAIPIDQATHKPEELNNNGIPIRAGVAGLWTRADNIHNPFLRVLGKIGAAGARAIDVAGSVAAPGVAAQIPGSSLNEAIRTSGARAEENREAKLAEEQATTEHTAAETSAIPSEIGLRKAETDKAEQDPQAKPESPQQGYAAAITDAVTRGVDPQQDPHVQAWATAINNLKKDKVEKPDSPEQQFLDEYQRNHKGATVAQAEQAFKNIQPPEKPQRQLMIVPDGKGGFRSMEVTAGMDIPAGAQNVSGFASMTRPTTQARNMGEMAQTVHEQIPQVKAEIDRLDKMGKLGPISGRMNDFYQGKIGADDPDYAALRTDLDLVSTAVMKAHFGGRGSVQVMQHFGDILNGKKQTAANLKANLDAIDKWMVDYVKSGGVNLQPGAANEPARPANVPAGYVYKENGPKGTGWYKP